MDMLEENVRPRNSVLRSGSDSLSHRHVHRFRVARYTRYNALELAWRAKANDVEIARARKHDRSTNAVAREHRASGVERDGGSAVRRDRRRSKRCEIAQVARRAADENSNPVAPKFAQRITKVALVLLYTLAICLAVQSNSLITDDTLHSAGVSFDVTRRSSSTHNAQHTGRCVSKEHKS